MFWQLKGNHPEAELDFSELKEKLTLNSIETEQRKEQYQQQQLSKETILPHFYL